MASKACPNPKSKEWRRITEKVGVFEAFRSFIRNGYDVPTFVFKEIQDVYKYLDFNASRNHILNKREGKYFIPYGRDLGTWYTNSNLVKDEVSRINKVYNGLLNIKSTPVTKPDPRTPGRTKVEWVEVNEHALTMHYDVYNEARKQMDIESGEDTIPIDTYEQRVVLSDKEIQRLATGFSKNLEYKNRDEASGNATYTGTFEGKSIDFMLENTDDPYEEILNDLKIYFGPQINKSDSNDNMFESLAFDEQRITDKLSPENRKDFEAKKEIMLKTFPRVKEVIEDYTIPQAGTLEANGTIIRVNPKYWTEDTIGHEFGHLLIDLIGGTDNPLIKKGIELLKESTIWDKVYNNYQDLYTNDIDKFHKEVLAQAIGEETVKLFKTQAQQSTFTQWVTRLFNKIKQLLRIESNAIKQLAGMVLAGKEINIDTIVTDTYESRVDEEILGRLESTKTPKTKIENLRNKVLEVLQKKEAIYKKRDFVSNQDLISKTIEKIQELDDSPKEGLLLFQDFAVKETERIYKNYIAQDRKKRLYNEPFSLRQLAKWKDYVSGFSILSEFITIAKDYENDIDESFLDIEKLNNALNRKATIEEAYFREGTLLVADALSGYSSHIEGEFKEKYEREYNKLSNEERAEQSKEDYIYSKLKVNTDNIKELGKKLIEAELLKASKDINTMARWIDNVLDSPDVVVSSMAKMFSEADFKARQYYNDVQNKLVGITRELEDFYKAKGILPNDPKKMYDFMLEKDNEGNYTQNIVDVYSSNLWSEYERVKERLMKKYKDNYEKYKDELRIWKNNNMPIDYNKFNPVKEAFLKSLISDGLLTVQEKAAIDINDSWETEVKKDISELVKSDKAVELIIQFYRDNIWKFRVPVKTFLNKQWLYLVEVSGGKVSEPIHKQREAVAKNVTNDPRINFYNFITQQRSEVQLGIPYGHRLHTRLPSVLKDSSERLISKDNTISNSLAHTIKSNLNVLADESERGERILTDESGQPVHFIPVYYTASLRKIYGNEYDKLSDKEKSKVGSKEDYVNKKADENQSYDLASIYARYFNSAIHYKYMSDILPVMEMARDLVNNRDTIQRDGKGNIIMQAIAKGKEKALTKEGQTSMVAAQLNDWFEAVMYGVKEKDEGTFLGGRIDVGKTANLLNKFTALNLLGLNIVQGVANTLLGSTMQWIESAGGIFYDPKDYAKAKIVYNKNMPGMLGDIGSRKPNNFVSLLLQKFDILNEYDKPEFRKNSKFKQLLTTNTLFFTSHAGEHMMQTKVLLAMLNRLEAKDKDGNVIGKMLDMLSVEDGKLKIYYKVDNFKYNDQALFETKVRRVLSSLHGEYSSAGRVAIQRYALGRMGYMFRKFIVPGLRRRWGKKFYNNLLEETTEGQYITTKNFIVRLFKDLTRFQFGLMSTDWQSLTSVEKANIRKTLIEVSFMLGISLLASALIEMKDDGDDDDEWYLSFLAYQAFRLKTEMWFFSNPSEAMKILRSPAASMSVIENTIKLLGQLMPPDFDGFERYERGNWKGRPKVEKTLINFIPAVKQIYRLKYVDDQISWLKN